MTTQTVPQTTTAPTTPFARAYLALTRAEVRRVLRNRTYLVPTLILPLMFFGLFGLPNLQGRLSGVGAGPYMVISYAAYALISTAMFSFGVSVAAERSSGWLRQLRLTPMSPAAYFAAKISASIVLGLLSITLLSVFARITGGVSIPAAQLIAAYAKLLIGMVPFALLGLAIGLSFGGGSAAPVANLINLPLMFASGIFYPLDVAPQFIRTLAPYLPAYHYGQLGWSSIGAHVTGAEWTHWAWLGGYGLVFLALAMLAYRRDEARRGA
ncbi:ABC transporter permease [Deinococcus maricopensis]|uniref:Transport permease protein n=1 Tax=Deinococcus maricopensis (strain DSM 21211 / LMG 22137 / NRRL B-23946 / LB-34) TaxID=709986 RepID=E8U6L7_DEIML|nr:ABC transporter permease [Deinococcus maricopensis]ADV66706.1 ABC-2 type transporter [Deinococcus maricopensis DSM 21211]